MSARVSLSHTHTHTHTWRSSNKRSRSAAGPQELNLQAPKEELDFTFKVLNGSRKKKLQLHEDENTENLLPASSLHLQREEEEEDESPPGFDNKRYDTFASTTC